MAKRTAWEKECKRVSKRNRKATRLGGYRLPYLKGHQYNPFRAKMIAKAKGAKG